MDVTTSIKIREYLETGRARASTPQSHSALAAFAAAAIDPLNTIVRIELATECVHSTTTSTRPTWCSAKILDAEPHQTGALIKHGHVLRQREIMRGAALLKA